MRHLLYIAILLTITACSYSSSHPKALDEAQDLMQREPSVALSKLNNVDVSAIQDSAIMARWALLYSEALVANRLTVPTDTIVDIAIDYYGRHNFTAEFKKASRLKDLIHSSKGTDALASALYLQKEKEFFIYKERAKRETFMLIGLIILLIAGGIIAWMSQRMKLQAAKNDRLMAEASGLKCQIDASRGDVSRLEMTLHNMLENRFSLIDSLCQTYYESQGTKTERKAIIDKVRSEIEAVRTVSFPEMEQTVNNCRHNILIKIKDNNPDIKPEDYMLLVYLASGLSSRTISLLLGESVDVIYKRKSRLKSRIQKSTAPVDPEVMDIF